MKHVKYILTGAAALMLSAILSLSALAGLLWLVWNYPGYVFGGVFGLMALGIFIEESYDLGKGLWSDREAMKKSIEEKVYYEDV